MSDFCFSSVRAEGIMNGYNGSLLLSTTTATTAVSGEGRAPEIPVKKTRW